jgi:chromate transporter
MYLSWFEPGRSARHLLGAMFVLPSFLMVLVLAALYVHYGRLPWFKECSTALEPQ